MFKIKCELTRKSRKQLVDNLMALAKQSKISGGKALVDFAKSPIMTESAEECPRDTWTLVDSRFVKKPVETKEGVYVDFGYGGPNNLTNPKTGKKASEYMIIVHEDLMGHTYKVGGPKFLENPVRRNQELLLSHIGNAIRATMMHARFK